MTNLRMESLTRIAWQLHRHAMVRMLPSMLLLFLVSATIASTAGESTATTMRRRGQGDQRMLEDSSEAFTSDCVDQLLLKSTTQDQVISKKEYVSFLVKYCTQDSQANNLCKLSSSLSSSEQYEASFGDLSAGLRSLFIQTACPIGTPTTSLCLSQSKSLDEDSFGIAADPDNLMQLDDRVEALCTNAFGVLVSEGVGTIRQVTAVPTQRPSFAPTKGPQTESPTLIPTPSPTSTPTTTQNETATLPQTPSETAEPTASPITMEPTIEPSASPSAAESATETATITDATVTPSQAPTAARIRPTAEPTFEPSHSSTVNTNLTDDHNSPSKTRAITDSSRNHNMSRGLILGIVLGTASLVFCIAAIWSSREVEPDFDIRKRDANASAKRSKSHAPRRARSLASSTSDHEFDGDVDADVEIDGANIIYSRKSRSSSDDMSETVPQPSSITTTQHSDTTHRSQQQHSYSRTLPNFIDFHGSTPGRKTENPNPMNLLTPRERSWRPQSTRNSVWKPNE